MEKLLPPYLFLICVIFMGFFHQCYPGPLWLSPPVTWLGLAPILIGIALLISGKHALAKHATTIQTFGNPGFLITNGVYRHTRNPIYLGFVVILAGISFLLGSGTLLIFPPLFFILSDRWYIRVEEKKLTDTFGEEFENYKKAVRRWM